MMAKRQLVREHEHTLPQADLLEMFRYEQDTGKLFWKGTTKRAGKPAGCVDEDGNLKLCVNGQRWPGGRIIWRMMTGEWPVGVVSYRDKDRTNLRWENLYVQTRTQLAVGLPCGKPSRSGVRGVTRQGNKFVARANKGGGNRKQRYFGMFDSEAEASAIVEKFCEIRDGVYYVNKGVKSK